MPSLHVERAHRCSLHLAGLGPFLNPCHLSEHVEGRTYPRGLGPPPAKDDAGSFRPSSCRGVGRRMANKQALQMGSAPITCDAVPLQATGENHESHERIL